MSRRWLRWLPAAVVPAVIGAAVVAAPLQAISIGPLPAKTPVEVLAMAANHQVRALTGTVEQDSDLGLPQLPAGAPTSGPGATSLLELLGSSHTARVFADGPTKVRVQVLDQLAERDLVRNGSEVWLYSSRDNTATHVTGLDTFKPYGIREGMKHDPGTHPMPTPEDIAQRLLAAADPSTSVGLGPEVRLAERSAYQLVLTPKTVNTLVASVAVYVDGETGMPLGTEVRARGQQEPAFRVAFTELSLVAPDASIFQFTPPEGATVKEVGLANDLPASTDPTLPAPGLPAPGAPAPAVPAPEPVPDPGPLPDPSQIPAPGPVPDPNHIPDPSHDRPKVTGSGWEAVVEVPAAAIQRVLDSTPLLAQAAVAVQGGRLLSTSLLNVLITDDGRAFAGAVPLERLQAVAAAP